MKHQMIVQCPDCRNNAPMRHLHSTAHGISDTHMAGSERFVCSVCYYVLTREQAENLGLTYTLDVKHSTKTLTRGL